MVSVSIRRFWSSSSLSLSASLSYLSCSFDMSDFILVISASIDSVDFFLAIVRLLPVHERLAAGQQFTDPLRAIADICLVKAEGAQDDLLCFCDCVIQLVVPAVPADHLDLLKLPDRGGDGHIFLLGFHPDHLLFKEVVYPVADDQGHKFDKYLG